MKKIITLILSVLSGVFAVFMIFVFIWKIKNSHQPGLADMIDFRVLIFYFVVCVLIFVNSIKFTTKKD